MKRLIFYVLCSLLTFSVSAQDKTAMKRLANFAKNVSDFNKFFPQEKVYLHFDNTGYFKGETIWFTAYVIRADKSEPTNLSRVLYVELVSPSGDILVTHKYAISDGQANGEIKLEHILQSGFYEVRAYTRYMTNWDNNVIFSRVFPVYDEPAKDGDYSRMVIDQLSYRKRLPNYREGNVDLKTNLSLRFYPEGGDLVGGLESRVAFDVNNADGAEQPTTGYLLNDKGDTVQAVSTLREGRGIFFCTPGEHPLHLMMSDSKNRYFRFDLPQARDTGCVMRLDMIGDNDYVHADIESTPSLHGRALGIMLMHNGNVIGFDRFVLGKEPSLWRFKRHKMPAGVSELTLFDQDGRIWADRMLFVAPDTLNKAYENITVSTSNEHLTPCGNISLNFKAKGRRTFSVSVLDAATETNGNNLNAANWLLISSDIKGFVYHPDFYLQGDDSLHRAAADLLMMVQGWRRYNWKQMAGRAKFIKQQPIEDNLYIDGQVRDTRKKDVDKEANMTVVLYNQQGQSMIGKATTHDGGWYAYKVPDCSGDWTLSMATKKDTVPHAFSVAIDRNFTPERRAFTYYDTQLYQRDQPTLQLTEVDFTNRLAQLNKTSHVLPTLLVKRHFIENARAGWEDERNAQSHACIYYNGPDEADKVADRGESMPLLGDWLASRNPFFLGTNNVPTLKYSTSKNKGLEATSTIDERLAQVIKANNAMANAPKKEVGSLGAAYTFDDLDNPLYGLPSTYKNRPVIYVINNRTGTDNGPSLNTYSLDEIKSVYISEDEETANRYLRGAGNAHAVTVFVYTYHSFRLKKKGVRLTHFQGFNEPSIFETPDYGQLPPTVDYRRTLYWNPSVGTDANGSATLKFYNNSSCKQIIISAEGISEKGVPMVAH
jgi:hypothetical protein